LTKADLQAPQIVLERHFRCKKSRCKQLCPEPKKIWTEAIAAGSTEFVEGIKAKLGIKAKHRQPHRKESAQKDTVYALQEPLAAYSADFGVKIETLKDENKLLWDVFNDI
jgi:hypothetical protein